MKLNEIDLNFLCEEAIEAAIEAGLMIAHNFSSQIDIQRKTTGSSLASQVVTEIDLKSDQMIFEKLASSCVQYDLAYLSEEREDDLSRLDKDYFWCVDPLDGTLPFTEKRRGYAVSIALVSKEGTPLLGVIYDPDQNTLYHAIKGEGAFYNRKAWQLEGSCITDFKMISEGGSVMNGCWVLENAPACFVKKPKPQDGCGSNWDYAATVCLFEEMGAYASDFYGDPLELNKNGSLFMNQKGVILASSEQVALRLFEDI